VRSRVADLGHVVHQVVHLHARRGRVGAPGEAQQAAHDTRGAVHLAGDGGRRGAGVGILAGAAEQLGLHPDRRERIVHLVGHTAGDLAHRGELLARDQLALRPQLVGPVVQRHQQAVRPDSREAGDRAVADTAVSEGCVTSTRPCHGDPSRGRASTRWSEISLGESPSASR